MIFILGKKLKPEQTRSSVSFREARWTAKEQKNQRSVHRCAEPFFLFLGQNFPRKLPRGLSYFKDFVLRLVLVLVKIFDGAEILGRAHADRRHPGG